jgi:dihydropteroate synthase
MIEHVVTRAVEMWSAGARYLDIGGESSRPGAEPVSVDEELERVIPVISAVHARLPEAIISIDTVKPQVAASAIDHGARVINDISGLRSPEMREVAAHYRAGVVMMHMRGEPRTMQQGDLSSPDLVGDLLRWFESALNLSIKSGIKHEQIAIDVGIGFGKTLEQNLTLLRELKRFQVFEAPLLVGVSRKSMIGALCGVDVVDRLPGSLAALLEARRRGASVFRVHDISESAQALTVAEAIEESGALHDHNHGSLT